MTLMLAWQAFKEWRAQRKVIRITNADIARLDDEEAQVLWLENIHERMN